MSFFTMVSAFSPKTISLFDIPLSFSAMVSTLTMSFLTGFPKTIAFSDMVTSPVLTMSFLNMVLRFSGAISLRKAPICSLEILIMELEPEKNDVQKEVNASLLFVESNSSNIRL